MIASFRRYRDAGQMIIIGHAVPSQVSQMQREHLALTTDLGNAQRKQRRQNRHLQQAIDEQRNAREAVDRVTAELA